MNEQDVRLAVTELEALGPDEILAWAARTFPGRVCFATSLDMEDQVITHLIATAGLAIPLFTLDTGRLFPKTYDLIERTEQRYGLRIRVMFPDAASVEAVVAERGVNLFRRSVEDRRHCCGIRKIEPLRRALAGADAWVCGLRAEQSDGRAGVAPVEWDAANGLPKINPLHAWTWDRVRAFAADHNVPVHPLHAQGFLSIGCACCTRAVGSGEPFRAGRWWWEQGEHKECGLHSAGGRQGKDGTAP